MLMNGTVQGQVGNYLITELLLVSAEVFCSKGLFSPHDCKYCPILNEMDVMSWLCAVFKITIHKMFFRV
jgi:hypothetical protein